MFKSVAGLGHGHPRTSDQQPRELFLFLVGIFYLALFILSVPSNLHAESLLYEHYPLKQVAPDTSYTETFAISGLPSNAVLTNVEVQFDYIAYGVYQNYVSARINKDSDPGTTGGAPIVSQGMLPDGNPGTYGYVSSSNWNNQNLINNTVFFIRFAVASGCPGSPTISKVRLRITYSVASPAVSITPTTGPQGTTFQEPGTGFTPNSTATLYFKYPDGSETDPVAKNTESDGSFSHSWTCEACPVGTYQYWAIDNATSQSSNTVSFTVNSVDSNYDPNWVKTYRLVRAGNGHQDHLYTTSLSEKESAEALGYIFDGEDFMVSSTPFTGGVEVARLRKDGPNYTIRLYTTGATEIQSAKNQGYVQEGSLGYVYAAPHPGAAEIKRCYHSGITDRFYTAYLTEFTAALAQGYREENPLGYAPSGSGHAPEQPHATAPDSTPCVAIPPMLKASAFAHQDADARHASSSWEVTKVQGDYSPANLLLSRVDDTKNLTTITPAADVLTPQTRYWWRVRYKDANGRHSSWSPEASFIARCYLNTPKALTIDGASILQHNCRGHYQKFVFNAIAGERYMVSLTPIKGDADLYGSVNVSDFDHLPDVPGNALKSLRPAGNVERFSVTASQSGPFYLAGYGVDESDYRIAVSTAAMGKITANRKAVVSGGTVHFDASGSTPSGHAASIASYFWEFSDSATATGVSVSHVFDYMNGAVQYATLTIMDDKGNIGQSVIAVNVTGTAQGTTANQSGHSSDPVNMATGNFTYSHTDLVVPGRGIPFVFSRAYNSIDPYFTSGLPLGHGWTHSFNVRLTGDPGRQLTVLFPDGHGEMYVADGQAGYTAQAGVKNTLTISAVSGSRYILTLKNQLSYHFDAEMRLTSIRDLNDNAITCSYDDQGKLVQITDTVGRTYALDYDPVGHLTQITDPIGRTLKYAYNGDGDLASFTDPTDATIGYVYDDRHQMTTVTDPNGVISINMVYDQSNRVVRSQSDVYGNAFTFSYDFETGITIQKDPLGHETLYAHDDKMRLISIKYPNGFAEYFTYDDQDNRISVTNRRGYTTYYTYDDRGNVTAKTDPLDQATTISYDGKNNPVTRTDALGGITSYTYDDRGNLLSIKDALGFETLMTYDEKGQLMSKKDANGNTTTYTCDTTGNITDTQDALGNHTTYTYDGAGRLLSAQASADNRVSYAYDENNRLLTSTDPLRNVTRNVYDRAGNLLKTVDPKGNATLHDYDLKNRLARTTDPLGGMTTYVYNALDQRIRISPPGNNATSFAYDDEGRLAYRTDPLGNKTIFAYDENGNLVYREDRLGRATRFSYDELDRRVITQDPAGNMYQREYDALGRVTRETDLEGRTTYSRYDLLGRLLSVIDATGNETRYEYDPAGNLLHTIDSLGRTTSMEYDAMNRLIRRTDPLNNSETFAYDSVGRLASHQDATGKLKQLDYDAAGRLIKVRFADGQETVFSYDANGNRTAMYDPNGTGRWAYDALNRVLSYAYNDQAVTYMYDASGNRNSLTYPDGKTVQYSFNSLDRLDKVTDWLGRSTVYQYDPEERLTKIRNPNGTLAFFETNAAGQISAVKNAFADNTVIAEENFTLDRAGNVLLDTGIPALEEVKTPREIPYTYDNANRLLTAGSEAFEYDANGSLMKKASGTTMTDYTYDIANRLSQVKTVDRTVQYLYDGLGNRTGKIENGQRTNHILDLNSRLSQVLAETDGSGQITKYHLYGLGLIETILPTGETQVYHYSSRGNTVAVSNTAGQIVKKYAYDDFGTVNNQSGNGDTSFKFLGRFGVMADGDLYHVRARYYDPEIGRFLTQDPMTGNQRDPQTMNRYIYALNNPIRFVDISGFSYTSAQREMEQKNSTSDELHKRLVNDAEKIKKTFDNPNVSAADKKREFIDFIREYGGLFSELTKGKEADAVMQLFDNKYATVTLDVGSIYKTFKSVGAIFDFWNFLEHYSGAYVRVQEGAISTYEDLFAEITAITANTAKDMAAGTVLSITAPLGKIWPSFNKDREVYRQLMALDWTKEQVKDLSDWILGKVGME